MIGQRSNRPAFAKEIVGYGRALDQGSRFRSIGVWEFVGMTGRWPQVLGLYEFGDGWSTFSDMVAQTMREPAPELTNVYARVEQMRSGGEDEILRPLEGCPTLDELIARSLRGTLLMWEEARVQPGAERQYAAKLRAEWEPVAAEHDQTLIGLYEGALTDGLVIAYWLTTLRGYEKLTSSGRVEAWRERGRSRRAGWRTELWTAAPGSRFTPGDVDFDESRNFAGQL